MKEKIRNGIKRIRSSKDATVLLSNFGYLTLLRIASYIFPLITIPYLAKVIGVEGFGKIAFASAVMVWFITIADWGFNYTATRDIAKNRDDKKKVSEIFSNVFWAKCLLMVFSFLLLMLALLLVPIFRENKEILLVSFLMVPGQIMFPDWFFQGLERMKYTTVLNLLSKLLFTIAVFVVIKEESDYILQPLLTSMGYIVSGVIAMCLILFRWRIRLLSPSIKAIISTIKGSTDVFINNLVPNFYNSFTTMLLGFFCGSVSNGIYDAGQKFLIVAEQFMGIIARTFFPYLSRRIEKHDLYVKLNIYTSLTFSFALFLLAPLLVKLFFTSEFYDAIIVLRIMSWSVFLISVRNAYGTHYMMLKGYEKELRNLTIYGSFIGFCISFPLIYMYDYIGAAITIIVSQFIMAYTVFRKASEIKKNEKIYL